MILYAVLFFLEYEGEDENGVKEEEAWILLGIN